MPDDMESNEAEISGLASDSENEYDDHDLDMPLKDDDEDVKGDGLNGEVKKKYDPKDPLRPRRKKARRACYACQRAHLTCGDERPCQRCIKRGLAEACQDGVRKKAKYLHDAPPEALGPVLGPNYNPNSENNRPNGHRQPSSAGSDASTVAAFFSQSASTPFSMYPSAATIPVSEALPFGGQQSPVSPTFQQSNSQTISNLTVPQVSGDISGYSQTALFDPSNPAIFNFNLDGLNFGSQYGAMEFGILGHMSSGAAETPTRDPSSMSQQGAGDGNFGPAGVYSNGVNQMYDGNGVMGDFLNLDPSSNGPYSQGNLQHGLPHAYAIAAGPSSIQSPSTENNSPQPTNFGFEGSPTTATYSMTPGSSQSVPHPRPKNKISSTTAKLGPQSILGKRQRDPSYIYEAVKEPFSYVKSFHNMIAVCQNRFSANRTLRIAKALASIRPSFISCTRTLNVQDLVFMEQGFQRTLFEYEDFFAQCSSPAIACRRTGEIACVNKEFTALTGWTKEVLLGKESNLNVNTGSLASDSSRSSNDGTGRAGLTTPRLRTLNAEAAAAITAKPGDAAYQPQPIFLAELMDDDSVVAFYEDYAQLAFNDVRGKVQRKCRLLKYRTSAEQQRQQQPQAEGNAPPAGSGNSNATEESGTSGRKDPRSSILSNRVARIDGEHGISKIERDGRLECSYTWSLRRDVFDIPLMIIINFLPCYGRNHDQLAV